jgi:YegS/Rv2252/BmrU family lipid kinase
MKPIQVILNPNSGRGLGARTKDSLVAALKAAGVAFELTETTRPGHALELAAQMRAAGKETVVAAGGDGTVNEVMNGLAQATPAGETIGPLAFCAIGTGNDFADMSGAGRGVEALAQRLAAKRTRLVDIGRGTFTSSSRQVQRYFDNNVGLGFEAQVTVDSNRIKRVSGPLRYLVAVFHALRGYTSPHMEVRWRDAASEWQQRAQPSFMISLGNSRRTGGLFYVTPDAVMDDGLLDLAIVPHKSKLEVLWLLPKTFTGSHRNDPSIHFDRCLELQVSSARPVPVHLDGEVVMDDVSNAHIEVFHRRLEIVV